MQNYLKKHYPLLLSFCTPVIILLGYFIYRGFYPFGSSSVLTVDLGQQYIDFFAYFRQTLLQQPSAFFYSFSKALGGQMLGEYAYYLLSPFNLIFLLFPGKYLTAGCLVVLLLKYGLAGYTFGRLLQHKLKLRGLFIPTLATSYALMGWMIANQLNMLWLDAPIFLPLIVCGLYDLLQKKQSLGYVLTLSLMMIINYYMAYMICLFLGLFFIWYETNYRDLKQLRRDIWLFLSRSLLAVGCASLILLPTLYSLSTSKGQYTENSIHFKFEYAPLEMIAKFMIGAFNFEQMPKGLPNLFLGSLALFGFCLYFLSKKIAGKAKIAAFLVSAAFVLSLCFEPLDLLWHGMQFPVWYPYRFSFVVSFWMIFLAAIALKKNHFALKNWQTLCCLGLVGLGLGYIYFDIKKFDFASTLLLLITALFNVLILLLLTLPKSKVHKRLNPLAIYLVVCAELLANTAYSLNNISYLTQKEFEVPTKTLANDAQILNDLDSSFYRTAQLYARTKNDGIAHDLNAGSYFSSALEKSIPDFYGQLGQPDGDNYVGYYNGTLISDALLGMKYLLYAKDEAELKTPTDEKLNVTSYRPDLIEYNKQVVGKTTSIYRDPYALSLGYAANKQLKKLPVLYDRPLTYQTNWLNAATGSSSKTKYFYAANFNEVVFQNTKKQTSLTGSFFKKTDLKDPAQIIFKFTPDTDDPYYLTLGPSLDQDNVTWYLGTREYPAYKTFRHTIVLNPTTGNKGEEIILTAKFKKANLWLQNFVLYRLDKELALQKIEQLKQNELKILDHSANRIYGTIELTSKDQFMATTIPYDKGWHAKVDGQAVKTFKIQDTFLGLDLTPGTHTIELTYVPPYFYLGCLISLGSFLVLGLLYYKKR